MFCGGWALILMDERGVAAKCCSEVEEEGRVWNMNSIFCQLRKKISDYMSDEKYSFRFKGPLLLRDYGSQPKSAASFIPAFAETYFRGWGSVHLTPQYLPSCRILIVPRTTRSQKLQLSYIIVLPLDCAQPTRGRLSLNIPKRKDGTGSLNANISLL